MATTITVLAADPTGRRKRKKESGKARYIRFPRVYRHMLYLGRLDRRVPTVFLICQGNMQAGGTALAPRSDQAVSQTRPTGPPKATETTKQPNPVPCLR
jgi:hypothetical protein